MAEAAVAPVADTPEAEVAPAVAAEVAEAADAKQKKTVLLLGQFFFVRPTPLVPKRYRPFTSFTERVKTVLSHKGTIITLRSLKEKSLICIAAIVYQSFSRRRSFSTAVF